jgi:hypothetical protein
VRLNEYSYFYIQANARVVVVVNAAALGLNPGCVFTSFAETRMKDAAKVNYLKPFLQEFFFHDFHTFVKKRKNGESLTYEVLVSASRIVSENLNAIKISSSHCF